MHENGLTSRQVEEARRRGQVNIIPDSSQKTVKDIIRENIFTYFNGIFAVLSVLLIIAGAFRSLTFLGAVVFNALIGIVQQLRAKKVLDELTILNQSRITVIRDGQAREVPTEDLVLGDVVIFRSGAQICADAAVLDGEISVNESLLTGESDEIVKKSGDRLLSGSFVVTGECRARLTHVGADSYVSRLEQEAREVSGKEESEMVRGINRFVLISGIAIIPIGSLLMIQGFMRGVPFSENVTSMVAAVVGMIPEGLYVLVSMTLAVSAAGLARKKVMLHDMKSIETLARVDVLCVDKTGTITEPEMKVEEMILPSEMLQRSENGSLSGPGQAISDWRSVEMRRMPKETELSGTGRAGRNGMPAEPEARGTEQTIVVRQPDAGNQADRSRAESLLAAYLAIQKDDNATMLAIREYMNQSVSQGGEGQNHLRRSGSQGSREVQGVLGQPLKVLPFSSRNKYSAVLFSGEAYLLGAPDIILGADYDRWENSLLACSARGSRLLLFARLKGELPAEGLTGSRAEPVLFIALHNPIRDQARETFSYFTGQGVTVKVISGDHPATVAAIAGRAGIPEAHRAVDASLLQGQEEIDRAVEENTVFARVTPERKKDLVMALQKAGHTVAMTGDGVNDIMAMKAADCSVAMASGSEAAVQAAQVVLLDSDFAHMPQIVAEGRRVIGNIERSSTLFLSKNIFSMLLAVFSIITVVSYPLQPEQISLVSGFNIGIPAFLLAMEPNERRITGHFMTKVLLRALPASITEFVLIAAMVVFGMTFGIAEGDIAVAATFILGVVGFMMLYYISRPMTRYRIIVLVGCMIGFVAGAILFHDWFSISYISRTCFMFFILFAVAAEPCMRYLTRAAVFIERKLEKENK